MLSFPSTEATSREAIKRAAATDEFLANRGKQPESTRQNDSVAAKMQSYQEDPNLGFVPGSDSPISDNGYVCHNGRISTHGTVSYPEAPEYFISGNTSIREPSSRHLIPNINQNSGGDALRPLPYGHPAHGTTSHLQRLREQLVARQSPPPDSTYGPNFNDYVSYSPNSQRPVPPPQQAFQQHTQMPQAASPHTPSSRPTPNNGGMGYASSPYANSAGRHMASRQILHAQSQTPQEISPHTMSRQALPTYNNGPRSVASFIPNGQLAPAQTGNYYGPTPLDSISGYLSSPQHPTPVHASYQHSLHSPHGQGNFVPLQQRFPYMPILKSEVIDLTEGDTIPETAQRPGGYNRPHQQLNPYCAASQIQQGGYLPNQVNTIGYGQVGSTPPNTSNGRMGVGRPRNHTHMSMKQENNTMSQSPNPRSLKSQSPMSQNTQHGLSPAAPAFQPTSPPVRPASRYVPHPQQAQRQQNARQVNEKPQNAQVKRSPLNAVASSSHSTTPIQHPRQHTQNSQPSRPATNARRNSQQANAGSQPGKLGVPNSTTGTHTAARPQAKGKPGLGSSDLMTRLQPPQVATQHGHSVTPAQTTQPLMRPPFTTLQQPNNAQKAKLQNGQIKQPSNPQNAMEPHGTVPLGQNHQNRITSGSNDPYDIEQRTTQALTAFLNKGYTPADPQSVTHWPRNDCYPPDAILGHKLSDEQWSDPRVQEYVHESFHYAMWCTDRENAILKLQEAAQASPKQQVQPSPSLPHSHHRYGQHSNGQDVDIKHHASPVGDGSGQGGFNESHQPHQQVMNQPGRAPTPQQPHLSNNPVSQAAYGAPQSDPSSALGKRKQEQIKIAPAEPRSNKKAKTAQYPQQSLHDPHAYTPNTAHSQQQIAPAGLMPSPDMYGNVRHGLPSYTRGESSDYSPLNSPLAYQDSAYSSGASNGAGSPLEHPLFPRATLRGSSLPREVVETYFSNPTGRISPYSMPVNLEGNSTQKLAGSTNTGDSSSNHPSGSNNAS